MSDLGLPRNGKPRLRGAALEGAIIKKNLTKDTVGEILNPGALKKKWRQEKNHSKDNKQLIKALETARTNKELAAEQNTLESKAKDRFIMPRFTVVPGSGLVPNVTQRDLAREEYHIVRDHEIQQQKQRWSDTQRTTSATLAATTEERNKVVAQYTATHKRPAALTTREVLKGKHLVLIAGTRQAKTQAYQAPSHKGPRGPEYAVRGRGDASSPRRPRTAPSKRQKKKIERLPEHQNVPCWWSNQASAWELLHVGEEGC